MGFIAIKCPSCNGDVEIDDTRDFGFCLYCGTKIMQDVQKVKLSGAVELKDMVTVENLLIRARQFLDEGDFNRTKEYLDKILDIDATNKEVQNILNEIKQITKKNTIDDLLPKVRQDFNSGYYENAEKYCYEILKIDPENIEVKNILPEIQKGIKNTNYRQQLLTNARICFKEGDFSEAINYCNEILIIEDNSEAKSIIRKIHEVENNQTSLPIEKIILIIVLLLGGFIIFSVIIPFILRIFS